MTVLPKPTFAVEPETRTPCEPGLAIVVDPKFTVPPALVRRMPCVLVAERLVAPLVREPEVAFRETPAWPPEPPACVIDASEMPSAMPVGAPSMRMACCPTTSMTPLPTFSVPPFWAWMPVRRFVKIERLANVVVEAVPEWFTLTAGRPAPVMRLPVPRPSWTAAAKFTRFAPAGPPTKMPVAVPVIVTSPANVVVAPGPRWLMLMLPAPVDVIGTPIVIELVPP